MSAISTTQSHSIVDSLDNQWIELLLDDLYEGAASRQGFNPFLRRLQVLFKCKTATLSIRELAKGQVTGGWYQDMSEEAVQWYINHLAWRDPLFRQAQKQTGFCSAYINHQRMLQDPVIENWCHQAELVDGACAIAYQDEQHCLALTLGRDQQAGHFNLKDLEKLNLLLPHLRRAISLHQKLQNQCNPEIFLTHALHSIETPLFIMTGGFQMQFANKAARQWLTSSQFLTDNIHSSHHLKLHFKSHGHNAKFYAELQKHLRQGLRTSSSITLQHQADSITLMTTPIVTDTIMEQNVNEQFILVSVHPWQQHTELDWHQLKDLFGFSRTESIICTYLCQGLAPEDIAKQLNRETSTVRSHIKSLFQKTNCSRQAELVALVLSTYLNHQIKI